MKKAFSAALIAGYACAVSVRTNQLAQLKQEGDETLVFTSDYHEVFPYMSDEQSQECKRREDEAAKNHLARKVYESLDSEKQAELINDLCMMCGHDFDEFKLCLDGSKVYADVQDCMGRDPSWFPEIGCLVLPEGSGATYWVGDEVYDLPVHIKYNFKVTSISGETNPHHEFISVFGNGASGQDALTWFLATHRNDFKFRTGKFRSFPQNTLHRDQPKLVVGEEHTGEVFITENLAEFYLDKKRQYSARLEAGAIPTSGKFGFTSYSGKGSSEICDFRTIKTYELPVGRGAPVWVDTKTSTLPLHITYRFRVTSITEDDGKTEDPPRNPHHEFIGVFGDPDDLGNGVTWHLATHRTDFQFRGKMWNVFPRCELKMDPVKLKERNIYNAEVYIDETNASLKLNGQEYYTCTFEAGVIPPSGQVAFTSYNGAGSSEVWSLFHLNDQHSATN